MTDTSTTRVQARQEYAVCAAWPDDIRIRVLSTSGYGRATVVTLTDDGREVRRRLVNTRQLHASPTTASGQRRRTGYYLVRNADGTAAAPIEEPAK